MPAPPEVRQYVVNLLRQLKMTKNKNSLSSVTWARLKSMQVSNEYSLKKPGWVKRYIYFVLTFSGIHVNASLDSTK